MKKLIVLGVVIGLVAMAGAHKPEGETYIMFQFTDDTVPTCDGNLSDWEGMPEAYSITSEKLFSPSKTIRDVGRGVYDPSDINITHRWGFNAENEFFYLATQVYDNYHDIDRENLGYFWKDDSIEIRINVTAVLEEEHNLEGEPPNMINYHFGVPPLEGIYMGGAPPEWMPPNGDYIKFGWSYTGEMLMGECTYIYEFGTTPVVGMGEDAASTEFMDVEEGEVVHINVTIPDIDAPQPATYNGFWAISPGPGNGPEVDFLLMEVEDPYPLTGGTAVEDFSWGMIKAGIAK